ncbi:MAG: glycosyltransferase [Ruminococcaceae bacterium]|nr:glycosyltransferase [Oscillospiraceae bacterium]
MKVLFINAVCGTGSTGKICAELAERYENDGYEVKIAYGRHSYVPEKYQKYAVRIGNDLDVKLHALSTRLTDRHGLGSKKATKEFLKWAEEYSPDLLWLHNIHGYYINYEMLFAWIKKHPEMEIKWTLHDCWAFTGHCSHFTFINCNQWKKQCEKCAQKNRYPKSFVDGCKDNFKRKKEAFTNIPKMTLITPSMWLGNLVKESFFKNYPVEVVYNTINNEIFKPTPSNFRENNKLTDKKIILGVSNIWDDRKGLYDFYELANMLDDKYAIVLVGLSEKQLKTLPKNIIGIKRTNGQKELAEIYTAADVFVNPTYEDNYPTVNLEARACGTPVITYRTGGSVESVEPENIVEVGEVEGLYRKIRSFG